ncbi:MAG: autotransporter outer membrane beta-barrel domain-containing protein, partial [Stenotrophomonas sp.]
GSRIELSGGSVLTTGYGASGVSADSGGHVQVLGTRIDTQGTAASGVSVTGGSLSATGVTITTQGGLSHGVALDQGTVAIHDSTLNVLGSGSHGLYVEGGSLLAENVTINHAGGGAGVWMEGQGGSDATLRNLTINGTGGGAMGAMIGAGNTALLQDVDINLTHAQSGAGLTVGGEVQVHGGRIHAGGDNAAAVSFASQGGKVLLDGTDVSGHYGIVMMADAQLTLRNTTLASELTGINVNQRGSVVDMAGSTITTSNGVGVLVMNDATVSITGSSITAGGEFWQAISVMGGHTTVSSSVLRTLGDNGHGLYAEGGAGLALIDASQVDILTRGDRAIGAIARLGGSVALEGSQVVTTGAAAHGVLAGGQGQMTLNDTHVRAEGADAWAAVINDRGRLQIDGGSLVSAQHGGLWVRSTRDPGVTLAGGAVVAGGNGIGIALDAAVAGRFDVAMEGGSQLLGDIVITPDDVAAGLVPQSRVHVQLAGGALWQGSSDLVQTLSLAGGSQWTLTADARVGALQVRDSTVAISDGSGRFNTLTVDGNLHSEGATFLFNGALGGDGSAIDRLHVRGDATGDAQVAVHNIGGMGAQTVDGITLIQVDGASQAAYTLAGRAVGGSYEYFLHQGGVADPNDGNWYLRSQWFDVCDANPLAPGCFNPDP